MHNAYLNSITYQSRLDFLPQTISKPAPKNTYRSIKNAYFCSCGGEEIYITARSAEDAAEKFYQMGTDMDDDLCNENGEFPILTIEILGQRDDGEFDLGDEETFDIF